MHRGSHRAAISAGLNRPRTLAGVAVGAVGLTLAVWLPTRGDVAAAQERGPVAHFIDNFSARRGPDPSVWWLAGPHGGSATVTDGQLAVEQALVSRQRFTGKFGHAEARIRVQRAAGLWRVFAVLDERGRVPLGTVERLDSGLEAPSDGDFHTYAIDWTPQTVTWAVDGQPSLRLIRTSPGGPLRLVVNRDAARRSAARVTVDFVSVQTSDDGPPTTSPSPSPTPTDPPPPGSPGAPPTTAPTAPPTTAPPTTEPPTSEPPSTAPPTTQPPTSRPPTAAPTRTPSSPAPTPTRTTAPAPAAKAWVAFRDYRVGDLVTFKGVTYRVLEAHTSLPAWEPPKVPELFAKV